MFFALEAIPYESFVFLVGNNHLRCWKYSLVDRKIFVLLEAFP
jgi:hypothetical protein